MNRDFYPGLFKKKTFEWTLILTILFCTASCRDYFDQIAPAKQLESKVRLDENSVCSSLAVTNQLKSRRYVNGTSVDSTDVYHETTWYDPTFTFQLMMEDTQYTASANLKGDTVPYNGTVTYRIPNAASDLKSLGFNGDLKITWEGDVTGKGTGRMTAGILSIRLGDGEGQCGFIYLYTIKTKDYGRNRRFGPSDSVGRSIATEETYLVETARIDVTDDLRKDLGTEPTKVQISERVKIYTDLLESLSKSSVAELVKSAGVTARIAYRQLKNSNQLDPELAKAVIDSKLAEKKIAMTAANKLEVVKYLSGR